MKFIIIMFSLLCLLSSTSYGYDYILGVSHNYSSFGSAIWLEDYFLVNNALSFRSGDIDDMQSSSLQFSVVGPGLLTFKWKVSSEYAWDILGLYIDDVRKYYISGERDWTLVSVPLSDGYHVIRFTYDKDNNLSFGSDAGFLTDVIIQADSFIKNGTNEFQSLNSAFNSSLNGDILKFLISEIYEDAIFNKDGAEIILKGGFNSDYETINCSEATIDGVITLDCPHSILNGSLTISSGTLIVDGLTIK